jgi:hypothetical protein
MWMRECSQPLLAGAGVDHLLADAAGSLGRSGPASGPEIQLAELLGRAGRPRGVVSYFALATLASAPFWARKQAQAALRSWEIRPETIQTAELLVSELVTNAVKFSRPESASAPPGHDAPETTDLISLVLRYLTGRVIVEVGDSDPRPPIVTDAGHDAVSGRGLMLVQALSKEWGHYLPPSGGKIVYCVLATA